MKKYSKKYVDASSKLDKNTQYSLTDAVKLGKETSTTKFDSTVEVAFKLNLDTKKADQQLRGSLVLPNGTGKTKKILVLAKGAQAEAAKNAGADYVGDLDLIEKIQKENWMDFDVLITTPDMMGLVGRLGKVLGPRGLMPNPKTGTVTMEIGKAVKEVKAGKIDFKVDKYGIVHSAVGKVSFSEDKIVDNANAFLDMIHKLKPAAAKGTYMLSIYLSTTMSIGLQIDPKSLDFK